jgi:hypothetical protein
MAAVLDGKPCASSWTTCKYYSQDLTERDRRDQVDGRFGQGLGLELVKG